MLCGGSLHAARDARRRAAPAARVARLPAGDDATAMRLGSGRVSALDPGIFKAYDIRGLYGSQIDGDAAEQIGRAFARVLGRLANRPTSELGIGLGRDMRLEAPELAERYKAGLLAEGVHVIDIGMVGTEMLYWLVGSRELDGGLMCTASHNPKSYTGAKLVRRGAIPLSGDAGIQDVRREIENGMGKAPGGGTSETDRRLPQVPAGGVQVHRRRQGQAAEGRRRRRQRHGRADGRPAAQAPRARPRPHVLQARRRVPRPRAEPAAAREPRVHHAQGRRRGRRPRDRVGRRRGPLLLHRRDRARSSTATS